MNQHHVTRECFGELFDALSMGPHRHAAERATVYAHGERDAEARAARDVERDLRPDLAAAVAHLDECAACAAEWSSYRRAIGTLVGPSVVETDPAHVSRVLARVAQASQSTTPDPTRSLDPTRSQDPTRSLDPTGAAAPRRRAAGAALARRVASHVVAVAAGALLAFTLVTPEAPAPGSPRRADPARSFDLASSTRPAGSTQNAAIAAEVVARAEAEATPATREVVTQTVTHTVTRVLPCWVIPVPYASRELASSPAPPPAALPSAPLPAAPLIERALRPDPHATVVALARSFERVGDTLARALQLAAELEVQRRMSSVAAERPRPEARSAPEAPRPTTRPEPVMIRREAGRVALSTSGPLDDVVTALLARVDDPDPAVRAAVELRLTGIASELGVERGRLDPTSARDLGEPWWRSERGQVAALVTERGGTANGRETETWNDWWARASVDSLRR